MDILTKAIKAAGGPAKAASSLGYKSTMAFSQWRQRGIPGAKVLPLARLTNWVITPHQLAPELYPHPDDGLPEERRGAA